MKMLRLQADASLLQQSSGQKPFNIKDIHDKPTNKFNFDHIDPESKSTHKLKDNTPKISTSTEKDSMDESYKSQHHSKYDVCAATFLDVAVLRCLFISHWQEDGVYWCLHYLYSRYVKFDIINRLGKFNSNYDFIKVYVKWAKKLYHRNHNRDVAQIRYQYHTLRYRYIKDQALTVETVQRVAQ